MSPLSAADTNDRAAVRVRFGADISNQCQPVAPSSAACAPLQAGTKKGKNSLDRIPATLHPEGLQGSEWALLKFRDQRPQM